MTQPRTFRYTHPGDPADGRLYRVTGTDDTGVVTAQYQHHTGAWRDVQYRQRLDALTLRVGGDLPLPVTNRAEILAALRPLAARFTEVEA